MSRKTFATNVFRRCVASFSWRGCELLVFLSWGRAAYGAVSVTFYFSLFAVIADLPEALRAGLKIPREQVIF